MMFTVLAPDLWLASVDIDLMPTKARVTKTPLSCNRPIGMIFENINDLGSVATIDMAYGSL
jgi:hypothetical protein